MNEPSRWQSVAPRVAIPRHPLWVDAYAGAWQILGREAAGPESESAVILYGRYAFPELLRSGWLDRLMEASPVWLAIWSAWALYEATGDRGRLAEAWPALAQRLGAVQTEWGSPGGLIRGPAEAGELANTPREAGEWIDSSAQQAIAAEGLAKSAQVLGQPEAEKAWRGRWEILCEALNRRGWSNREHLYLDCRPDGSHSSVKTTAAFWPMLAGAASAGQAEALTRHLSDPESFWRVHVFPSLAADQPRYADRGVLQRGGVWPLTNYAILKGLERYGFHALARRAADNHITTISHVNKETRSLWDNYAPDYIEPGSIAQPGRGASGLAVVALLIETVLGFRVDAPAATLHWRPGLGESFAIEGLRVGDALVHVQAEADANGRCHARLSATTASPLRLHLVAPGGEQWLPLHDDISVQYSVA